MTTAAALETPVAEDLTQTQADSQTETSPTPEAIPDLAERLAWSKGMIRKHALAAAGVGLIPMPAVDFVALTALQANLLRKISAYYKVPFSEEIGKKVVGALIGSFTPLAIALPIASMLKAIPLVGQASGVIAMSGIAGASTYAIGKVFVQHFESGGTFLNFDPETVREFYREQLIEGHKVVREEVKAEKKAEDKVAA